MEQMQVNDAAATTTPERVPYPGLLPTIGFILLYFMLQGLCTVLIMATISDMAAKPTSMAIIFGLVGSAVIQLILMWLYLRKNDRIKLLGLHDFGKIPLHKATGLAFLLVVAAMIFNFLYAQYVIPGIGMQDDMKKILAEIARTPVNMAAMFVAIAIAAPIVEELLFRGFLQNALTKYVPVWGAIILSSFLFSLVHLQPYAIPGLMSLSLAFGYLYHRTGSLRTNIVLHMANNAFALFVSQVLN
jgi:membrane protease YdiL (CAAX protease family)